MLTQDTLKELLHYDPATGEFKWLVTVNTKHAAAGDIAGGLRRHGYWMIGIKRRRYYAHRLAYLYMTGEWPPKDIDHIDGNPLNNRWINLRPATRSQNMLNTSFHKNNKLGVKGVCWDKSQGKYLAQISVDGENIRLGRYDSPKQAALAFALAAEEYHGEFANYLDAEAIMNLDSLPPLDMTPTINATTMQATGG